MTTSDKKLIQITGRVIERKTIQGLSNLRVEAWDKDLIVKDDIGAATTDQQGVFVIEVLKRQLKDLFADRHVLLFFKVFRDDQLLTSTEDSVLWDREAPDSEIVIKVKLESPEPPDPHKTFTVSGQVRRADGSVFKDGVVQALITIREQQRALGETKTDPKGRFEIVYTLDQSQVSELANARVVARVFDSQRSQLAESASFVPDAAVTVNLTVPNPPPPPAETLSVQGQVRLQDGSLVRKAIVRAFITTPGREILLGEGPTDSSGNYEITAALDSSLGTPPTNARLEARVFDKNETRLATSSSPIQPNVTIIDVVVSTTTMEEIFTIRGQVLRNERPVGGVTVRIFGVVPGPEEPLGDPATTNSSEGAYEIQYKPGKFDGRRDQDSRVQVRVYDDGQRELFRTPAFRSEPGILLPIRLTDQADTQLSRVWGTITHKGGGGFDGTARIFSVASKKQLGNDAPTGDLGQYEITYEAAKLPGTVGIGELVIVRAYDALETERAQSAPFNAVPLKENIDLVVTEPPLPAKTLKVSGLITEDRVPLPDAIVRAFDKNLSGTLLGATQSSRQLNEKGHYEITYTVGPAPSAISRDPDLLIAVFTVVNNQEVLRKTSAVVPSGGRDQVIDVDVPVPPEPPDPGTDVTYTVAGTVTSPDRAGVNGLRVQIVDKNIGPDVFLAEIVTDENGSYKVSFVVSSASLKKRCKQNPDLQARAFAENIFLAASEVRYFASTLETLNVTLPANSAALPSEYELLISAIARHCGGILGNLQESDDRQDITYLANKTGWDARAIALAALADQFSRSASNAVLPPAVFYALFRAGLPANDDILYRTDAATISAILSKAIEQGVIPKSLAGKIPQAAAQFQTVSAQKLLTGAADIGTSSLSQMLSVSGLTDAQKTQFAELYAAHRNDTRRLWAEVSTALGVNTANRLQVDGKLGFLTINNAPLMQAIHSTSGSGGVSDPIQLAQQGYHNPAKWTSLLTSSVKIPSEIPGDTPADKKANYSKYLAAQVRLSYPTASVAQMVGSGELPLTGSPAGISTQVRDFLNAHQGNFEIGMQPVRQYVKLNNVRVPDEIVKQVSGLQRVLQITPSDQAMIGLMKNGIDSAYQVVRHEKDVFVQTFAPALGGPEAAEQTYDKAVQVHNAALNIAVSYLTAKNGIPLGGGLEASRQASDSSGFVIQPTPTTAASDVIAYPTLEGLFGEMDFCACDHCRSVLSPAAYLVDLLLFLDREDDAWVTYLAKWRLDHGNAPYPFGSQAAWIAAGQPANTERTPLQVLLSRRPDLQHLPLTCENTNTALPYIDVVNETLEYFIANTIQSLSLNGYAGHDTDGSVSADLLASPQFVIDSAYTILRSERFPFLLPFHQPLEGLRRYFEKFEVALPMAMERLRKSDALERGANPYGWRDILIEELRLSRDEYQVLSDSTAVPFWRLFGFPNGTSDADIINGNAPANIPVLSNAKQFTRRAGITFEDIVAILQTRFVNPNSDLIPKLERLGVPFATLKAFNDGTITDAAFDALLPTGAMAPDPAAYGHNIKEWIKDDANFDRIKRLITLTDPAGNPDPCNFDTLEFRFLEPSTRLGAVEFFRILRFIRLWKKLGWTIEQTDAAICALFRADLQPLGAGDVGTLADLDAGFSTLLPRLGIVVRVMRLLNLTPKRDLPSVLALWSPIGTHGGSALYRQMFLNPAMLTQDEVFADKGSGEFLTDLTKKLGEHAGALRSAFNLTGDEFDRIFIELGYDENTPLTVPNISAIFRRGYLARKLKLSVREVLSLTSLTGLDPFALPDPTDAAILRLISLVLALRERPLKTAVALCLIWNRDLSGKSAPAPEQITEFTRTLRGDFAVIEDQFAAAEDPNGDIARARMTLVYGQEASDAFFELLDDTLPLDTAYTHPTPALEAAIIAANSRIAYDDFRHRLSYTGVLTAAKRDALKLVAGVQAAFRTAVDSLFAKSEDAKGSFFARFRELEPLYNAYVASPDPPAAKRSALLAAFRPQLSRLRKRQQALQRLSAVAGIDSVSTQTLLDPAAAPFPLHAAGHDDQPALNDVLALETPGLLARFFFRDTATGAVDSKIDAASNLDYEAGGSNPLPANPTLGAAISGIWSGQIETKEAGFYNFVIETDAVNVTLTLGGQARPLIQNGNIHRNSEPLELKGEGLYDIDLKIEQVTNRLSVKWETPKRAREVIPSSSLYPPTILAPFADVYVRFLKAASLAVGLRLTAAEIAHFSTDPDYQIGGEGWLNQLSVSGDSPAPALLKPFRDLLDYARIKAEISHDDERLLAVIKNPTEEAALALTRWDEKSLNDLLGHFGYGIGTLVSFERFRKLYDAFALIQKMRISANALIDATTNEPAGDTVRDFQADLRARFDSAAWRDVVQAINDAMRGLQRDALVAYILHRMRSNPATRHIDTADKLFEYFLMDVQMEPCMQTSRVRHALSSAQLFIERSLMNLEPRVAPAAINGKQWEWMKRYRVWEANRKVFLFPENWLEPELRDDKSPFFKEIESELLQSDITEDSATSALVTYLSKLEEVAKLEPCGIYHIPADPSLRKGEVDHVIARTAGGKRKYYYRRFEFGYWTPWEQIKLDIEDNPVTPYVWKGRLLLFWLRILKQAPVDPNALPDSPVSGSGPAIAQLELGQIKNDAKTTAKNDLREIAQAVLCWSEFYNGKWQPTKTSDVGNPSELGRFVPGGPDAFNRSNLRLSPAEEGDALRVRASGEGRASFLLYNTHTASLPDPTASAFSPVVIVTRSKTRDLNTSERDFIITNALTSPGLSAVHSSMIKRRPVLTNPISDRTVTPLHRLTNAWDAPFFYEDSRHVFFVTVTENPVQIRDRSHFGIVFNPSFNQAFNLPSLIVPTGRPHVVRPTFTGDGDPIGPDVGNINPGSIQRFVTEDAFIHRALGTAGSVTYGNTQIGPSGAIPAAAGGLPETL